MSTITLDKVHDLLEKLAEYVMTELPTRKEMDARLAQKADKSDLQKIEKRIVRIETKMDSVLTGMDAQAKQLDAMRHEMKAISGTLDIHEKRLGDLEQRTLGYRVREEDE